ncbi:ZIP family metal transporter [bacterium]|nr:ZIP family metal transporter [bacterium]
MSITFISFAAAFAVMLISLSGVLFAAGPLHRFAQRRLPYLASFAGGVFLIVVYHLLEESLHEGSVAVAAGAILFGAALMEALHHILPDSHHHHGVDHGHAYTSIDGRRVLLSDALHNVGDGVLIVASFAADFRVGIAATIGILIHEFVQEISEFFVLKEAGYSTRDALLRNFLASSTILIGVVIALYLASAAEIALLFAGLAAGGFLAVILRDIIPHTISSIRTRGGGIVHLFAVVAGIALMVGVQIALPHQEHEESGLEDVGATTAVRTPDTLS